MQGSHSTNSPLRIADLRVDPALDEIEKDGVIVKLEPRAMRLLMSLAERAGQVVSVEELLNLVWKDVVVSPDSVYAAVASLRRTLGDDPKNPKYIANVMRRGYRLIAPVSPITPPAAAALPVESAHVEPPQGVRRRPWTAAITAIVLGVLVGAAAVVYFVREARHAGAASSASRPATVSEKSVAVLPFLDLSEKKDEQYFADGLSEELIDRLVKVPDLQIPARTSSFYFRNKEATIAQIAQSLGVAHVLEGSVRKSGDTLRITAQLVRADNGYHVWSQTFDRPAEDIFKIQDEIAVEVVRALKATLMRSEGPRKVLTASTEAYNLYLKARSAAADARTIDFDVAIAYLQQALILDPNFASAWSLLAKMLTADLDWGDSTPHVERCAQARKDADQALRLDPQLPDAHTALGRILYVCDWDWTGADAALKQALSLDPSDADAVRLYANLAWYAGWRDKALMFGHRAVELDPLNPSSYFELAMAEDAAGRVSEAVTAWRKAIELGPTVAGLHGLLANELLAQGKPAEALDEAIREGGGGAGQTLPFVYEALGRTRDADAALEDYKRKYPQDAESVAEFYACRKEAELTFQWLERTLAQHVALMDTSNRISCFKNVEHDPRFQAILRKMNLPAVPSGAAPGA